MEQWSNGVMVMQHGAAQDQEYCDIARLRVKIEAEAWSHVTDDAGACMPPPTKAS